VAADVPIAVYPAMLAGTMAGHFLGVGFDVLVLRDHSMWAPLGCSVLLEAVIGARYGAARVGHPLTSGQRGRLSIYYSLALTAVSLPLAGWLKASSLSRDQVSGVSVSSHDLVWVAIALVGLVVYTAVRYGLMAVFSPASSPAGRPA
jgi:hypothetical protein